MRSLIIVLGSIIGLVMASSCAGEEAKPGDALVKSGHDFALQVCAACHVAARDQASRPILNRRRRAFSRSRANKRQPRPFYANFSASRMERCPIRSLPASRSTKWSPIC